MASPSAKYSNIASITTSATPSARMAVEPHNTRPTTNGISTAAVTTRFHVIENESPANSQASSHHIEGNKSRGTDILQVLVAASFRLRDATGLRAVWAELSCKKSPSGRLM